MSKVEVYLVGDKDSPKTNQWLAMTASLYEADKFALGIKGATRKTIEVKPQYKGKRR